MKVLEIIKSGSFANENGEVTANWNYISVEEDGFILRGLVNTIPSKSLKVGDNIPPKALKQN